MPKSLTNIFSSKGLCRIFPLELARTPADCGSETSPAHVTPAFVDPEASKRPWTNCHHTDIEFPVPVVNFSYYELYMSNRLNVSLNGPFWWRKAMEEAVKATFLGLAPLKALFKRNMWRLNWARVSLIVCIKRQESLNFRIVYLKLALYPKA
jgi:hypothetical protein